MLNRTDLVPIAKAFEISEHRFALSECEHAAIVLARCCFTAHVATATTRTTWHADTRCWHILLDQAFVDVLKYISAVGAFTDD